MTLSWKPDVLVDEDALSDSEVAVPRKTLRE